MNPRWGVVALVVACLSVLAPAPVAPQELPPGWAPPGGDAPAVPSAPAPVWPAPGDGGSPTPSIQDPIVQEPEPQVLGSTVTPGQSGSTSAPSGGASSSQPSQDTTTETPPPVDEDPAPTDPEGTEPLSPLDADLAGQPPSPTSAPETVKPLPVVPTDAPPPGEAQARPRLVLSAESTDSSVGLIGLGIVLVPALVYGTAILAARRRRMWYGEMESRLQIPEPTGVRPPAWWVAPGMVLVVAAAVTSGLAWAAGAPKLVTLLPIAAVGAIGVGLLAVFRFEYFLSVMLAGRASLDAAKVSGFGAADITGAFALLLIIGGVLWLAADRNARGPVKPSPLLVPMVTFVAAAGFSVVTSENSIQGAGEVTKLAAIGLLIAVLNRFLTSDRRLGIVTAAVLVSSLGPIAFGLAQVAAGQGQIDGGFSRITGSFVHPNPFAMYLAFMIILCVAIFPHVRRSHQVFIAVIMSAGAPLLFLTYTRAAWIAVVAGVAVVGLLQSRLVFAGLVVAILSVGLLVPSASGRLADLSQSTQASGTAGNSLAWRFAFWQESIELVENPVTGIGLSSVVAETEAGKSPHSDFIRVYVEMGVIGIGAYAYLLLSLFSLARRAARAVGNRWIANAFRLSGKGARSPWLAVRGGLRKGLAVAYAGSFVAFVLLSLTSNVISQLVILLYFATLAGLAAASLNRSATEQPVPEGAFA